LAGGPNTALGYDPRMAKTLLEGALDRRRDARQLGRVPGLTPLMHGR
jgi:hypothetical protein